VRELVRSKRLPNGILVVYIPGTPPEVRLYQGARWKTIATGSEARRVFEELTPMEAERHLASLPEDLGADPEDEGDLEESGGKDDPEAYGWEEEEEYDHHLQEMEGLEDDDD